jgi:hypothetical protein
MKRIIFLVIACASLVMAQSLTTMQAQYNSVKSHSVYQSVYDLSLSPTSNATILLSAAGASMLVGMGVDFAESTLSGTDIDIRLYRAPYWTNGTTPTTSPIWQASYAAAGTLVTGVPDPMDLNQTAPAAFLAQPIGTWLKKMGNSTYAAQWAGMSNIGTQAQTYLMVAPTVRNTVYLPAPIMVAPNRQNVMIVSNRTAAVSNAVVRIVLTSLIPR